MFKQLWMIATVWANRPMMWMMAFLAVSAFVMSTIDRNRTVLRSAFHIPGESEARVSHEQTSTLANREQLQQSALSGHVDTSVEGIDLTSMELGDLKNPGSDFASLEQALANYPSVQWIRFDTDQIQHVSKGTLGELSELTTIIIHDDQITQADINQVAKFSRVQTLVLETLDFPASLSALANLPNLNTLVMSHGTSQMTDMPVRSLFRPEVLSQTHKLVHLRQLVLMPQWLPGEGYFAGSKTPDPACDPILKQNAAKLIPGHPSLTDLWLGIGVHESSGKDLAAVQAAMPDVKVRSAKYDENSISRVGFGSLWIMLLTSICMFNLCAHFSTPQRRVIPNYEKPHLWFAFGFAMLVVIVSAVAMRTPVSVGWLPAMSVSALAVAFAATLTANMTVIGLRRPEHSRIWIVISLALLFFAWIRPVFRQSLPSTAEAALAHFLDGHQPVLAIVITVSCLPAIYWMISQFTDSDRLNAEAGLPPTMTKNDFLKRGEILGYKNRADSFQQMASTIDSHVEAWNAKLETIKSKPAGWLRDIQLNWMGESKVTTVLWGGLLAGAAVVTFFTNFFSLKGREFGAMYVCLLVGVALVIPFVASSSRQDSLPLELLFPSSRSQFIRRRTLSIAAKYAYLFAGLFVYVAFVQFFCFHTFSFENLTRAAIVLVSSAIAGTGLVLWGLSIRNILALGVVVVMGLVVVMFASFSCLDFRWIKPGTTGQQIHEFVTRPVFYAACYAFAGFLLSIGYHRLSRCELARL